MVTKYKAAVFIIAAMFSSIASAAYTTMTIEGVKEANGVWTAAGVMDTQGFIRQTAQVSVYNTTRNLPVTIAADVTASSALMKGASRALGPVALAVTAIDIYNWYTSNNLTNSNGAWGIGTGEFSFGPETNGFVDCSYLGGIKTTVSYCFSAFQKQYPNKPFSGPLTLDPSLKPNPGCWQNTCTYRYKQPTDSPSIFLGFDIYWPSSSTTTPHKNSRPATDADFNNLPNIPTPLLSNNWSKFPSLTGKTPVTGVSFTPFSQWMGDPYFKDGQWWRDRMDISPSGTTSSPTRVKVDIGPVKIEGATDPGTVPDTGPAGGGGTAPQPDKEKPTFCEANPMSIACAEMGELKDENLEVEERPVDVSYTPWGSSTSQCPADKVIPLWDEHSLKISYSPVCQFASLLRPLVIALAFVAAGFIVAGITRKGAES